MFRFSSQCMTFFVIALCCSFLSACSSTPGPLERHQISTTIIYADEETINLTARGRGYAGPSKVNGFYDPVRNEIWCPNNESFQALRTCGHELRHLVKGQFHF